METIINLKVGESKILSFHSFATAGYLWEYSMEQNNLILVQKTPQLSVNNNLPIGANNDELFTIKGLNQGIVTIIFSQRRTWEKETPSVAKKAFKVVIFT